jgi:nuclear transport factor 2 (NTF2) superfamily protein
MATQLKPLFSLESVRQKVQRAERLWNSLDPQQIALAYTVDSQWRNRNAYVQGRDEITQLLDRKWQRELDCRLKKELFTSSETRIAVHYKYEYHSDSGQWFRAYGNEHWNFDARGLMHTRDASINEIEINISERMFF